MATNMLMEKITCILRDKYIIFDGVWGSFNLFFKMWLSWKCVDRRLRKDVILYINVKY